MQRLFKLIKLNFKELICLFGLILIAILFWWPTRELPYWWDSAGHIMHGARYYLDTNFSSWFLPSDSVISDFAHFPLFPFLLALSWKIFGESLFVSHVFYLFFILLSMVFTFLLMRKLAEDTDDITSLIASCGAGLLILFTPLFLAQIGIIYTEIPAAAFALMTIYLFISKNKWGYLLGSLLMVSMKVTSVVIILAVLLTVFLDFFKKRKEKKILFLIKELFFYSLPILFLALWFGAHKLATGWAFIMPGQEQRIESWIFGFSKNSLIYATKFFLFAQSRKLITFGILFVFISLFFKKRIKEFLKQKELKLLLSIILLTCFSFGKLEFLHRYLVFALPFFYLLFFFCLIFLLKPIKKQERWGVIGWGIAIICLFFSSSWNSHRSINSWHFPPLEENLEYRDIIAIGEEAARFIERYYENAVIWTSFPTSYMLSEPFQGYTSKQMQVYECKSWKQGDHIDLVVFHFFSPGQKDCLRIIKEEGLSMLLPISRNGKIIQIYKKK